MMFRPGRKTSGGSFRLKMNATTILTGYVQAAPIKTYTDQLYPASDAIADIAAKRIVTGRVNSHTASTAFAHNGVDGFSSGSDHI
jgi:hypothetical protein